MTETSSGGDQRISYDDLLDTVRTALQSESPPEVVDLAAMALVDGQALGNARFGLGLLSQLDPRTRLVRPRIAERMGGRVVLDGSGCFGPLVMAEGVHLVQALVREHGIAIVAARSVAGMGRLAPYVEAIARGGSLAIAGAASSPAVAPHEGHAPFVGTNPLAVALPSTDGEPLVLDIASLAATMAEVHKARDGGAALPEGVAVDANGSPTTDPDALGAVLPRGGLLGTMIGVAVEAMTAGVTGEPPVNTARTVTLIAVQCPPDSGQELRRRLLDAGGREPSARARTVIARARREGLVLDADTADTLAQARP